MIPSTFRDKGIWTAPDKTMVAWFRNPDGNMLSLTQFPTFRRDS